MNSNGIVKLTDFGISKEMSEDSEYCNTFCGTLTYMYLYFFRMIFRSPERIESKKYNSKSDIWSLGIILIELATGNYPYP